MRIGLLLLLLLLPGAALASQGDDPAGFSFDEPRFAVSVRGSRVFARAGSDIFDFFREQLTIERRDFDTPAISSEFGIALTRRIEVVAGFEYGQTTIDSQYRQFVFRLTGAPIPQTTSLENLHIGGSVKYALFERGHDIGQFVWIPRGIVSYVGVGAGVVHYRLLQDGNFVDVADRSVFRDTFEASGWAPSTHVLAGVDIKILPWLYASAEARYAWTTADLGPSFVGFAPMDLSGLRTTAGVNVRF